MFLEIRIHEINDASKKMKPEIVRSNDISPFKL